MYLYCLQVISPKFHAYIVPLTLIVLFLLFIVQKRGTAGIGARAPMDA